MSFIVVPHGEGDLSTRSFEISYRRLRVALFAAMGVAVLVAVMAATWFYNAAQAARVPFLERRIARLETELARQEQLERMLLRMEQRYEQLRTMLGADVVPPVGESGAEGDGGAGEGEAGSAEATVPASWPLEVRGYVTREHLARVPGSHPGIDIAVREGSRVRAAGAGTVVEAAEDSVYGKFVRIRHAEGYESMYGHLSSVLVAPGAPVARDQVIGLSGNTGVSTAPHLHFEVRREGEPVDPRTLVQAPR